MFKSWPSMFKNCEFCVLEIRLLSTFFSSLQKATNVRLLAATDRVTWQDCIHITEGNCLHFMSGNVYEFLNHDAEVVNIKMNLWDRHFSCSLLSLSGCPRKDKVTPESKWSITKYLLFVIMFRSGRSRSFCTCVITAYNSSCLSFEHLYLLL